MSVALSKSELQSDTVQKLVQIDFNYRKDSQVGYYRMSNEAIFNLMKMKASAFRVFLYICKHIDLYPLKLLQDPEFVERFEKGEKDIPAKDRTIEVRARDYIREYNLGSTQGYREFADSAIALFKSEVTWAEQKGDLGVVGLLHPIEKAIFTMRKTSGGETHYISSNNILAFQKDRNGERKSWTATSCEFVLSQDLAQYMFFLRSYFTRIDSNITKGISKPAALLYSFLKMKLDSDPSKSDKIRFLMSLDELNDIDNTNFPSVSKFFSRSKVKFSLDDEITKKTDLHVFFYKDEQTKKGNKYVYAAVEVSRKHCVQVELDGVKEITRPRLPRRPKVLAGSHEEGVWARKTIKILIEHQKQLELVGRKLIKRDRESLERCLEITGGMY